MAQPLDQKVPPFCLACFGTDNKFATNHVLSRWQHIAVECSKRNVMVVSFGGDGDSRVMKAMRISTGLFSKEIKLLSPLQSITYPTIWSEWFWMHSLCNIAFVQDTVHIAVKLKCRLLKPSVVLPMGTYTAGPHHLQIIIKTMGKNVHGLRERDIDHKDKQNYDAVLHIIRSLPSLDQLPDAAATKQFIILIQTITDSYLDKGLHPLTRIEKIWYATFSLRYWRQWILEHPMYTLKNNFITQNAYICTELNAHAVINLLILLRDVYNEDEAFLTWLLGSQTCEKTFRLARSMTTTFSTIINFSMLGLMRRLHRLQLQSQLHAESHTSGVVYPVDRTHQKKSGTRDFVPHSLKSISNSEILETVIKANARAKEKIKELGMEVLNVEKEEFCTKDSNDDGEQSDQEVEQNSTVINDVVREVCMDDPEHIKSDIQTL